MLAESEYLANGEELLRTWSGELIDEGGNERPASFGTTNRRLVCLTESGLFKDIDYIHVSSIETEPDSTDFDPRYVVWFLLLGGISCVLLFFTKFNIWMLVFGAVFLSLGLLIRGSGEWKEDVRGDNTERISILTGDEELGKIEFTTSDEVSAALNYVIRRLG